MRSVSAAVLIVTDNPDDQMTRRGLGAGKKTILNAAREPPMLWGLGKLAQYFCSVNRRRPPLAPTRTGGVTMATAWSRAARLADRTPASRNRYVDFLRAASMLVVTVGHWLAAAPHFDAGGQLIAAHILTAVP